MAGAADIGVERFARPFSLLFPERKVARRADRIGRALQVALQRGKVGGAVCGRLGAEHLGGVQLDHIAEQHDHSAGVGQHVIDADKGAVPAIRHGNGDDLKQRRVPPRLERLAAPAVQLKHGLGLGHAGQIDMADRTVVRRHDILAGCSVLPAGEADAHGVVPLDRAAHRPRERVKINIQMDEQADADIEHLLFARILQRDKVQPLRGCDRILFHQGSPFFFLRCFTGLYQFYYKCGKRKKKVGF